MLTTDITCADEFGRFLKLPMIIHGKLLTLCIISLRDWLKRKKAIFA